MKKSIINFIFFSLLPATSFAGQIANVKYTHDYITQATGITVTKNAGASDTSPVNMSYLLTAIDAANNPTRSTYSLSTTYRSGGSATTNAVDTDTVINGIATLYNCKGPGGYKSGTKCLICPKDYYCPSGSELSISCSTVGTGYITDSTGSSLSSQCHASVPSFRFVISTASSISYSLKVGSTGTCNFQVNWGDGNSNSYTTCGNKTHLYSASNQEYTISVSGSVYANTSSTSSGYSAALLNFTNDTAVRRVLSDYMYIFPNYDLSALTISGSKNYFMSQLFYGATGFTSLSDDFLSGTIGTPGTYFLANAFTGLTNLTSLPTNFLSGVTGSQGNYFLQSAFLSTGLTSLPANFLSGISGSQGSYFLYTAFQNTKLTSLPTNFLSNISGTQGDYFMTGAFLGNTTLTGDFPSNFLSGITGSQGRNFLSQTFQNTRLNNLPSNFLSGITGVQGQSFMSQTFSGCTTLTSLPSNFLSGITGVQLTYFLDRTFSGTSLTSTPDNFLGFVTGSQGSYFMSSTFQNVTTLTKLSLGSWAVSTPLSSDSSSFFVGTLSNAGNSTTPMQIWFWWKDYALAPDNTSMSLADANVAQIHVPANLLSIYRATTKWSTITDAKFTPILCSDITTAQIAKFGAVPSNYCCTDNATTCTLYNGSNYTW